jgi:hypothetical protein
MSPKSNRRTQPNRTAFDLIQWVRSVAPHCPNRGSAHVLLVLATYANAETLEAWPSLETIASDCG